MSGSITLAAVAQRTAVLAIACDRCDRAGRYPLATLIGRHGAEFGIPMLLRELSGLSKKKDAIELRQLRHPLPRPAGAVPGGQAVTPEEFATDLDALISNARMEGLTEQELAALLREAAAELVVAVRQVSRIVRPKVAKPKPRAQPALAVPVVVWRPKLRRWRTRIVATDC